MTATATIAGLATDIVVSVDDPALLDLAVEHIRAVSARLDATVNRDCESAEIEAVDLADGQPVLVSSLLDQLIIEALYFADLTDDASGVTRGRESESPIPAWHRVQLGRGTVTVPSDIRLELMPTARAFLTDRACRLLTDTLGCGVTVQAGPVTTSPGGAVARVTSADLRSTVDPTVTTTFNCVSVVADTADLAFTAAMFAHRHPDIAPEWLREHVRGARLDGPRHAITTVGAWPTSDHVSAA
jgi:FAD:protein FMN transferase